MHFKERIEQILKLSGRAGIENLLAWMDKNGFYDAPCSSKYHLAKPGGLAEHSLNVYRFMVDMSVALHYSGKDWFTPDFINSCIICSLLHDLGKAGQFGKPAYIAYPDENLEKITYETNKEMLYVPHEIRSVAIASQFIELTEEEQFAILYHNGLYGELKGFKGNETPLLMLLHWADMWACRVVEE